ncbi:MAG: hypothetical protein U9R19_13045 [Bacteroidota bacterium]|nr:hypothetical protein [Bacteroidota bacterium]
MALLRSDGMETTLANCTPIKYPLLREQFFSDFIFDQDGAWGRATLTIQNYSKTIIKTPVFGPYIVLFKGKKALFTVINGQSKKTVYTWSDMAYPS